MYGSRPTFVKPCDSNTVLINLDSVFPILYDRPSSSVWTGEEGTSHREYPTQSCTQYKPIDCARKYLTQRQDVPSRLFLKGTEPLLLPYEASLRLYTWHCTLLERRIPLYVVMWCGQYHSKSQQHDRSAQLHISTSVWRSLFFQSTKLNQCNLHKQFLVRTLTEPMLYMYGNIHELKTLGHSILHHQQRGVLPKLL